MKVMLAQSAGFCFGVRRAVQLAEKIAAGDAPYVMLGIRNDRTSRGNFGDYQCSKSR